MKVKQPILLLLAICLLLTAFCACGGKEQKPVESGTDPVVLTGDDDPMLKPVDGGGNEFHILCRKGGTSYVFANHEVFDTGNYEDRVNYAVFRRNSYIEDKYKVIVVAYEVQSGFTGLVQKDFSSGDGLYDLIMPMVESGFDLAIRDFLVEWELIPHVDRTRPYWMSNLYDATSIGGYHFFCSGAANLSAYNTVPVVFFNKEMHRKYGMADLYEMVKTGKWTVEQMKVLCSEVTCDLNDGIMDENDQYGLSVGGFAWQPFFYSSGLLMVEKDSNDIPYIAFSESGENEQITDILTSIVNFFNDTGKAILTGSASHNYVNNFGTESLGTGLFLNSRVLFWVEAVYGQFNLRDMKDDYGIIPIPVWKENEPYTSYIHATHSSVSCITVMARDKELSGSIMEDMAYSSEKIVIPEFYEQTIRIRGTRDSQSYEMLGIIFGNIVLDLAQVMKTSGLSLDNDMRTLVGENRTDIASTLKDCLPLYSSFINTAAGYFTSAGVKQYSNAE